MDSESEEDDDESTETLEKIDVANERAMELFLESGVLGPLEKLSNVQYFELYFRAPDRHGDVYEPTPNIPSMLKIEKQKIERNFAGKDN